MESITRERIRRLLKQLEDAMSAVAFAEAGEFETARSLLRERRKILLALTGRNADTNAFRYAINICSRIKAGLEILYIEGYEESRLEHYRKQLEKEGIEHNLVKGKGCIREEILRYTDNDREIQFVVVESPESQGINCKEGELPIAESYRRLKCPLVVVSEPSGT
jgi:K+-sensing histidine kinase KdpD